MVLNNHQNFLKMLSVKVKWNDNLKNAALEKGKVLKSTDQEMKIHYPEIGVRTLKILSGFFLVHPEINVSLKRSGTGITLIAKED